MKKNRTLYLLIVIIFILCCVAGVIIAARMSLEKVKVTYEEVVNEEVVSEELVSEAPELQDEYIAIADEKDYKEMAWDYSLISDVVYGQAEGESGTEDLQLDIYRTTKEGMNPAIILFHGGGLTSGDKASAGLLKSLAIDYAKAAYDWMLVNGAEYGADTKYVAIGGYSSGADISINMCYSNYFADLNRESILCVIDISGGDIYYGIEKDTMPGCVIVHGTNDTTVSFSKSENTAKFLESKNIDVELNALEGLNHDLLSRYEEVEWIMG